MGQMKYIFDTSIIIDALRQDKKAKKVFEDFDGTEDKLYISSITAFELFSGKSSKNETQSELISDFLSYFILVDLNWKISKIAGEIYRDEVKNLDVPDYIIAATAREIGAHVVTLNIKHFKTIPNLMIYKKNKK